MAGVAGVDAVTSAWLDALGGLRAASRVPMVFGGTVAGSQMRLDHFDGARTTALAGVAVHPGRGMGGRAWREQSALVVHDYETSSDITHQYDEAVLSEGLRGVVAAPVVVRGSVRGVLYAGVRVSLGVADRLRDAAVAAASRLSAELVVEEEVERRLIARERAADDAVERLRSLHAELRVVQTQTSDTWARNRLAALTTLDHSGEVSHRIHEVLSRSTLNPREIDVLALAALGLSYAAIAERLRLRPQTVKSYMRDLIVRLGAHSRHEAVVIARRHGFIP